MRVNLPKPYPSGYFKSIGSRYGIAQEVIAHVPRNIKGPFLDVGCGHGWVVLTLAKKGKRVEGIDFSPAAIKSCQKKLRGESKAIQALANFQLANATKLPFKKETFQCVFLIDVVEHLTLKQMGRSLKEVCRVLQNGGILIIHTNNKYFEEMTKLLIAASYHGIKVFLRPKQTLKEANTGPYDYLHINFLTGEETLRYLRGLGFEAKIKYVKPRRKEDLQKFLPYGKKWKEIIFYNLAWLLLNLPTEKFFSPTFWVLAKKRNR